MTDERKRAAMAERAARAGGAVARQEFRTDLDVETKSDAFDPVTQADRDAQEAVVGTVLAEFPDDAFVCEEEVEQSTRGFEGASVDVRESIPDSGAAWVVDPIDGTVNYVRELRLWTTVVAAVVDGDPVAAATYFPATGDVYTAGPDGATRDGRTLQVSDRDDPASFLIGALGKRVRSTRGGYPSYRELSARFGDFRRVGSMQAALAFVADGAFDAAVVPTYVDPWDTVAGVHLIRQAGGTVTDLAGGRWTPDSDGLVASNGHCHGTVLEAVADATS